MRSCLFFLVTLQSFIFGALQPISGDGAALFSYINNSGESDSEIFIQVFGVNPNTGAQCFVSYDNTGTASYFDVTEKVDSQEYSYPLSFFPENSAGTGKNFYLPKLDGARIFTSVNSKLSLLVSQNAAGVWTISSPDPLNPSDPNKDFLWDKTEFAVNDAIVFINPTAVDSFSLPLHCQECGKDGTCQQGGLQENRSTIFTELRSAFAGAGSFWSSLMLEKPNLAFSPMYAAATNVIKNDFFVTSGWIEAFKSVFSKSFIIIDAEESLPPSKGGGYWKGLIDPDTNAITFNREVDERHPKIPAVTITLPTKANELIGGNGPSWNIINKNPLQAVFARNIACAIDTNTLTTKAALGMKYFDSCRDNFYKKNTEMPNALQFIDLYSKVLHSFGNHMVYTIPYDDELGQSGSAAYIPSNYASGSITLGPL